MDNTTLPLVKIIPPIQQPTDSDLLLIFFHILFMTFGICGNISQISIQIYHRRFRRKSPISLGAPYVVLEILSKQWSFSRATCQFSEITGQIGRTLVPYTISAIFLATGFPEIFAILPGFLMSVLVLVLLILLRVGESAQLESHLLGQAIRANNNTIMFEIFQCTVPFRAQIYTPGLAAIIELVMLANFVIFAAILGATQCRFANRSIEETNWSDEAEIRERLGEISREKFAHHYHYNSLETNRIQKRRVKRDGGIVSGPIATALVTGMIGMTAKTVNDLTNFNPRISEGGCEWFGTAPLCNFPCPADYDFIRMHNGRCSTWWMSGFCSPDPSFGKPCTTIFGDYFSKRFCCKSDPSECTWSGRWMGANTAHNIYCRYDNVGKCGMIDCSINHFNMKAQNSSKITGERCDQLELFGLRGKATCGYIAWFNENGDVVNSWYKTRR
ncbi:unnamed protein product [Caenorhabditis angaria]|uniref:Uncharacterized protein n=1 Tax=Caenorhabditis angaria TaxID=860376 RepID=A0A9P1IKU3_9PELO|nr:unnamed protein product [Caenorhabditis angaria]